MPEQMQLLEIEETIPAQVATSSVLVSHPLPGEKLAFSRDPGILDSRGIGHSIPGHSPISLLPRAPGIMVTRAKSLYDAILKGPQNTSGYGLKEKYSILDMMSIFQRLAKGGSIAMRR